MRITQTLCLVVIAMTVVLAFGDIALNKFFVYKGATQFAMAVRDASRTAESDRRLDARITCYRTHRDDAVTRDACLKANAR